MRATQSANLTMQRRLEAFDHEQKKKKIQLRIAGVAALLAALFLIILFGGETFAPVRSVLGIEWLLHDRTGVYADCNDERNKDIKFCRPDYANQFTNTDSAHTNKVSRFERPDSWLPFSLNDK